MYCNCSAVDGFQTRNPHDVMNLCEVLGISKATSSQCVSKTPNLVIQRAMSRKGRGIGTVEVTYDRKHKMSDSHEENLKSEKKQRSH